MFSQIYINLLLWKVKKKNKIYNWNLGRYLVRLLMSSCMLYV